MKRFKDFLFDNAGATAIEYAFIAVCLALAIVAAVNGIGTNLSSKFVAMNTSLK